MSDTTRDPSFCDKLLRCQLCGKDTLIPQKQIGGFWHLRDWANPHGVKFSGGYCAKCFWKLHKIKKAKQCHE